MVFNISNWLRYLRVLSSSQDTLNFDPEAKREDVNEHDLFNSEKPNSKVSESHPEQSLCHVPRPNELEILRQRAVDIEKKIEPTKEGIRPRYKKHIIEILDSIECNEDIEETNLFLKAIALESLLRLSVWHNEEANRKGQELDLYSVGSWRRDEGKLLSMMDQLQSVVVSENDWMNME